MRRRLSRFREHPRGLLLTPCIQHPTSFLFFLRGVKRAVPAVVRPSRQARSASASPYSTYITYSTYSLLGEGRFFASWRHFRALFRGLRVTRFSGTGYQIFRNGLPDFPTGYLNKTVIKRIWLIYETYSNQDFDGVKSSSLADNFFVKLVSLN